jgi:DNA-binding response OmpR family regulator
MVSAYTEVREISAARDSGVSEYFAKPNSGKFVFYRLRSIIENPDHLLKQRGFSARTVGAAK